MSFEVAYFSVDKRMCILGIVSLDDKYITMLRPTEYGFTIRQSWTIYRGGTRISVDIV